MCRLLGFGGRFEFGDVVVSVSVRKSAGYATLINEFGINEFAGVLSIPTFEPRLPANGTNVGTGTTSTGERAVNPAFIGQSCQKSAPPAVSDCSPKRQKRRSPGKGKRRFV
jgi:hypothetical protein